MQNECRFIKSLDDLQNGYAYELGESAGAPKDEILEIKMEIHTRFIACMLGLFIEHELDKCKSHGTI